MCYACIFIKKLDSVELKSVLMSYRSLKDRSNIIYIFTKSVYGILIYRQSVLLIK